MTTEPKRRGAPAGNKNASGKRVTSPRPRTNVSFQNPEQMAKFHALGGSTWLQALVDATPLPHPAKAPASPAAE